MVLVGASPQDSWVKAAGQWVTKRDWPAGEGGRSRSLETIISLVHCAVMKLNGKTTV